MPYKDKEKRREYHRQNRDRAAERGRLYREANKEKIAEKNRQSGYSKRWREANREKDLERKRQYRKAHPEANRYRKRNPEKENPERAERVRARSNRRWAEKAGAEGSHTIAEWKALCDNYGNKCLACGNAPNVLTRDHVMPLSKGGSDDISNIQCLCLGCNVRKGTRFIDYR